MIETEEFYCWFYFHFLSLEVEKNHQIVEVTVFTRFEMNKNRTARTNITCLQTKSWFVSCGFVLWPYCLVSWNKVSGCVHKSLMENINKINTFTHSMVVEKNLSSTFEKITNFLHETVILQHTYARARPYLDCVHHHDIISLVVQHINCTKSKQTRRKNTVRKKINKMK